MFVELVAGVCFLLLVLWWRMKPFYWQAKGVPYSVPYPIIGNNVETFFNKFHEYWNKKYSSVSKYGGLYGFHNFGRIGLLVSDPELVKEICVNKYDCFSARGIHTNPSYDLIAKNVFFLSGDEWKRIRTKLTPYFSPSRLKHTTDLMSSNFKEYSDCFESAARSGEAVNVNQLSLKLSTDVVVNTIFGVKPDSFSNPNSFFFSLQDEIFGFTFVLRILLGTISPFVYDLFRVTCIPGKTIEKLRMFVEDVIDQRKRKIGVREDFIQGMLELVEKESSQPAQTRFGIEEAISQCAVMYMGGTETTGNTISYMLHELALHQDVQNKAREEITRCVASSPHKTFNYELINSLTYTNMVINECLRKYPIVPVITRECTKATSVGGVDIDVGTAIFVPVMALHWDPRYYPEPEKLRPERFADDAHKDQTIFMPFGLGPRTCIGWKMAMIESAYALCELLPKFRILPSEKTKDEIEFSWKPTLNPEAGIWLNVQRL